MFAGDLLLCDGLTISSQAGLQSVWRARWLRFVLGHLLLFSNAVQKVLIAVIVAINIRYLLYVFLWYFLSGNGTRRYCSSLFVRSATYTIVWFLRAPRWYIGPTAMPRAAVTPIAPERSEGAIGCDSRPRHCRRDDILAWRPNKITLLALLPLDLTMYYHFISFFACGSVPCGALI